MGAGPLSVGLSQAPRGVPAGGTTAGLLPPEGPVPPSSKLESCELQLHGCAGEDAPGWAIICSLRHSLFSQLILKAGKWPWAQASGTGGYVRATGTTSVERVLLPEASPLVTPTLHSL